MASLSADTVLNILQVISDWRGESTTNSDSSRIRAVSRAERNVAERALFRVHHVKDQTIGTGDGSASTFTIGTAAYPYRDKGLSEIFVGGTTEDKRYGVVDFQTFKDTFNRNNAERVAYEYYDQASDVWKVKLAQTPANGTVVYGSWYYLPPKRTLSSDTVVSPSIEAVAHTALAEIYHSEDELQKEQLELQAAENLVLEAIGDENAPAVGQTYQMGAIENAGRQRGFGTY